MTEPVTIAPARAFDVEKTNPTVRHAFQRLAEDERFGAKQTLREQVLYPQTLFDEEFPRHRISYAEIGRFFDNLNDAVGGYHQAWGQQAHKERSHPTLTNDELTAVKGWIDAAYQRHDPMTLADAVAMVERIHHKVVTTNALQKALTRAGLTKTIIAHPEEAGRLFMRHDEIARYTTEAAAALNDVPAASVFNMDSLG